MDDSEAQLCTDSLFANPLQDLRPELPQMSNTIGAARSGWRPMIEEMAECNTSTNTMAKRGVPTGPDPIRCRGLSPNLRPMAGGLLVSRRCRTVSALRGTVPDRAIPRNMEPTSFLGSPVTQMDRAMPISPRLAFHREVCCKRGRARALRNSPQVRGKEKEKDILVITDRYGFHPAINSSNWATEKRERTAQGFRWPSMSSLVEPARFSSDLRGKNGGRTRGSDHEILFAHVTRAEEYMPGLAQLLVDPRVDWISGCNTRQASPDRSVPGDESCSWRLGMKGWGSQLHWRPAFCWTDQITGRNQQIAIGPYLPSRMAEVVCAWQMKSQ